MATAEKATPAKKEKKAAEPEGPKMIGTKEVAAQLDTKPATLRRYLRSLPKFQDSNYTRYKWEEGDKTLEGILAGFEKFKASEKEKNAARLATLKDKAAKGEGKAGKKTAAPKKAAEPAADPDDDGDDDSGGAEGEEEEEIG